VSRWEGAEEDSGRSKKTIRDRGKILLMLFAFRFMFAILFAKLMRFYNIIPSKASAGY